METFKGFSEKITDILKEKYKYENIELSLKKNTGILRIEDKNNDVQKDYNLNEMYKKYMVNRKANADLREENEPYKPKHFAQSIKDNFDTMVKIARLGKPNSAKEDLDEEYDEEYEDLETWE